MKIWIDFINSPQVSFFELLVNELKGSGHEVVLTCRDSANTVALLKQRNWNYTIITGEVKKNTFRKLFAFPGRIYKLYSFLKNKKVDVAVGQSSFYLPLTATLLGIPSIYTNDNEHAMGNIVAFLFATKIFIPESLPISKVINKGARRKKVSSYPGIKEGIYLWPKGNEIQNKRRTNQFEIKRIYVRPEPFSAQYYSGKINFLDDLLIDLKDKYPVTILSREDSQLAHYKEEQFKGIEVPAHPIQFEKIAEKCSLFIGAGGSMTREMALMGIPTISVYQGDLLEVDKFLIAQNLMMYYRELTFEDVERIISNRCSVSANLNLINKGNKAYQMIKQEILKYNK